MNERTLTDIRSQLDDPDFAKAWEQGKVLTIDKASAFNAA